MTITRVLCAVDLHDTPPNVVEAAVRVAERHRARLTVVHAVPKHERFNERSASRAERITALTAAAKRRLPAVDFAVQQGSLASVILLHARAGAADVLVLGSGRPLGQTGRRTDAILRAVVRRSRIPVLLVPGDEPQADGDATIVCATTLKNDAPRLLEWVDGVAERWLGRPARLKVVHVINSSRLGRAAASTERSPAASDAIHLRAWRRLQAAIPTPARLNGTTNGDVMYGEVPARILAAAAETRASLIVLGAPGRFGLASLLGRSAIGDVVRQASCPILIVPAIEGGQNRLLEAA